jgi:hypothetical protein
MLSLYLFLNYLKTFKRRYLVFISLLWAMMVLTSYSAIPFVAIAQILWFYRPKDQIKKPRFSSILSLNMLMFTFLIPWVLFVLLNYPTKHLTDPYDPHFALSLKNILYGLLHDWAPHLPLMISSTLLLLLFPFVADAKRNAWVLLSILFVPVFSLYTFCRIFNVSHFITSRYFVTFLPLFLVALYLSIESLESKFQIFKQFIRLRSLFLILFIASNVLILPLYYKSEKQDFRGVAAYLQQHLRGGDAIYLGGTFFFPGLLHYFHSFPSRRHYELTTYSNPEKGMPVTYKGVTIPVYYSTDCCFQYVADGTRLWIVVGGKKVAEEIRRHSPAILKGYFDGSFLNFNRFPTDASLYLFLWDPKSPDEKGIDIPLD